MTRVLGMGSLYQRGSIWWLKFYRNGRPIRESSHSTDIEAAKRLLKKRAGQIADGKTITPRADRVKVAELLTDWITTMKIEGRSSVENSSGRAKRLARYFQGVRAHAMTTSDVNRYVETRQEQGIKPASINLDLAALKRAFNLGLAAEKIHRAPKIKVLPVHNARQGFFERAAFDAVHAEIKQEVLADMAVLAYWTGWRGAELRKLECRQVDTAEKALRMESGVTKGKEARIVYLPPEAWAVVEKWFHRRMIGGRISRHLVHRYGRPVGSTEKAWNNACIRAGHPGMYFHDLRRTAVRNMVRAGIRESVAMAITGHKTRAVFERYNIIDEGDLREAAAKMVGEDTTKSGLDGHKRGHKRKIVTVRR